MKKLIYLRTHNEPNDCVIKWRLTRYCNTQCPYCLQGKKEMPSATRLMMDYTFLCGIADDISALMERSGFKSIKLDILGGEASIFDLVGIMKHIKAPNFNRLMLTTNFLRSADYYIQLAEYLKSQGAGLSLTVSWHPQAISLDDYIKKAELVKPHCTLFSLETVSTADNQDEVKEFVRRGEEIDSDYSVDVDRQSSYKVDELFYTSSRKHRNTIRYTALFSDGTEKQYTSKNDLLMDLDITDEIQRGRRITTGGYWCTVSKDTIYIDEHGEVACYVLRNCCDRKSVKEFNFGNGVLCTPGARCSMCGNMSLFADETVMEKYY